MSTRIIAGEEGRGGKHRRDNVENAAGEEGGEGPHNASIKWTYDSIVRMLLLLVHGVTGPSNASSADHNVATDA